VPGDFVLRGRSGAEIRIQVQMQSVLPDESENPGIDK